MAPNTGLLPEMDEGQAVSSRGQACAHWGLHENDCASVSASQWEMLPLPGQKGVRAESPPPTQGRVPPARWAPAALSLSLSALARQCVAAWRGFLCSCWLYQVPFKCSECSPPPILLVKRRGSVPGCSASAVGASAESLLLWGDPVSLFVNK